MGIISMVYQKLTDIPEEELKAKSLLRVTYDYLLFLMSKKSIETAKGEEEQKDIKFRDSLELSPLGDGMLFSHKYNLLVEKVSNTEAYVRSGGTLEGNYSLAGKSYIELI